MHKKRIIEAQTHFQNSFKNKMIKSPKRLKLSDYEIMQTLGTGES